MGSVFMLEVYHATMQLISMRRFIGINNIDTFDDMLQL